MTTGLPFEKVPDNGWGVNRPQREDVVDMYVIAQPYHYKNCTNHTSEMIYSLVSEYGNSEADGRWCESTEISSLKTCLAGQPDLHTANGYGNPLQEYLSCRKVALAWICWGDEFDDFRLSTQLEESSAIRDYAENAIDRRVDTAPSDACRRPQETSLRNLDDLSTLPNYETWALVFFFDHDDMDKSILVSEG
jgi:hypothetical protein